jgi:glycosyltransferase involved in cell wall biosynthesis
MPFNHPKISILTPSYNQNKYIEENIRSVLAQNYPNFEHIIIDGGSSDNTLEIIKKYAHLKYVSEKDLGQADALNKGIKMSSGDIIGWINSDDYYLKNAFFQVAEEFVSGDYEWIIGNIINKYEASGKYLYPLIPKDFQLTYKSITSQKYIINQQGTFFRKSLIEKAGLWNINYYMAADFDLWLRAIKLSEPKMIFNKYWAVYRIHEAQKTSFKNMLRQFTEHNKIFLNENVALNRILVFDVLGLYKIFRSSLKHIAKILLLKMGLIKKNNFLMSPIRKHIYFDKL